MSQQPLFWYRPRSDGGYEGPLHNGQIEDIRKASGAWVPLFAGAAPVNAEPSDDEIIDIAVEPLGIDCVRMPYGVVVFARALLSRYSSAPVAVQPDLTQQTLDDVMAGIPARDAEIEALRKEIEALQAAPVKPYSLDQDPAGIRALAADAISGALALGYQGVSPPPNNEHWLAPFWEIGRESAVKAQQPVSGADGATERALAELVDKIMPGLDTGDLLADAATASKTLDSAKQDADPLQGAADWLVKDCGVSDPAGLANRLGIGYNRASRLVDAARKEQA